MKMKINPVYRLLIYIIDYLIFFVSIYLILNQLFLIPTWTAYKYAIVVFTIYQVIFTYFMNGQTLGKKIGKVKVIASNGGELSFYQVLSREVAKVTYIIPVIGLVLIAMNIVYSLIYERKLVHDFLTNTKLVYEWFEWGDQDESISMSRHR